jgi:hypothetical protein
MQIPAASDGKCLRYVDIGHTLGSTGSCCCPSTPVSGRWSGVGASTRQALVSLPEEVRRAVRWEIRRDLGDTGGPIGIEMEGGLPAVGANRAHTMPGVRT